MDDAGIRGRISPAVALALVCLVGAVVGGVAFAQSTNGPSGETILNDTYEKYASAETLTGTAEVTVSNASANHSGTVEYAIAVGDGARVALTGNGTTVAMGTNGSVAWVDAPTLQRAWNVENDSLEAGEVCRAARERAATFDANGSNPAADEMESAAANLSAVDCASLTAEWKNGEHSLPTNLSEANLTATRTGTETLDGTEAYVVSLAHENESVDTEGTVWIATNDSRLLKARVTDGTNTTTVRYEDQRFNASIHEGTFAPPTERTTSAPETYDSFDAANESFDGDLPKLAADGFEFETATVTGAGGGTVVAQQYANAATNATLVTTDGEQIPDERLNGTSVDIDGQNATAATMQGRTIVVWTDEETTHALVTDGSTDEETTHALVTDGSTDEAVALAESVQ
jgi:outer membrane lipoprotein-sorting protein